MSELAIGLRRARTGGLLRVGSIVLSCAVAAFLLAAALAIPPAVQGDEPVTRMGQTVITLALATFALAPSAVLIAIATRLSAATRDSRLVSLRLLGFSAARTRVVAAVEAGSLAAVGAILGSACFALVVPLVPTKSASGIPVFRQPLALSGPMAVLAASAVTAVGIAVTLAATTALSGEVLHYRRPGVTRRVSRLRAIPFAIGLGLVLAVTLVFHVTAGSTSEGSAVRASRGLTAIGVGGLLLLAGTVLVVPLLTRTIAEHQPRPRAGLPTLLAARRVQTEPSGTVRVLAGVALSTYVAVTATGFLGALAATREYQDEARRFEHGPLSGQATPVAGEVAPAQIEALSDIDGITLAWPVHMVYAQIEGDPRMVSVVSTSCEALQAAIGPFVCDPARPAQLAHGPAAVQGDSVRIGPFEYDQIAREAPSFPLADPIHVPADLDGFPVWQLADLFVPTTMPGAAEALGPAFSVNVVMTGGYHQMPPIQDAAAAIGLRLETYSLATYTGINDTRALVGAATVLVIGVGLLGVLLGAVDQAVERRRTTASLAALGVPVSTMRSAQFRQVAVPLVLSIGLAGAGAVAVVTSAVTLVNPGVFSVSPFPIGSVTAVIGGALVAAVLVAWATTLGTGGRLTPEVLRRE